MKAVLILMGVPLDDTRPLAPQARETAAGAQVIVGETRKIALRLLREVKPLEGKDLFFLDPPRDDERQALEARLRRLAAEGGTAVLFSDGGMPVLFDPGREVLELCRRLGFTVRSTEGATSWGMACALSGFAPPFLVVGFLPRESRDREAQLRELGRSRAQVVLMDTPYRFELLLAEAARVLGNDRRAFLAWELTKPEERLLWGTLGELGGAARREGLRKGEFILILEKK